MQSDDIKKQASLIMGMAFMKEELKRNIMEAVKELSLKITSFVEEEAKVQTKIEKLLQLFEVWNP